MVICVLVPPYNTYHHSFVKVCGDATCPLKWSTGDSSPSRFAITCAALRFFFEQHVVVLYVFAIHISLYSMRWVWVSPIDRVADIATHESKTRCLSLRLELYHEYVLCVLLMIG